MLLAVDIGNTNIVVGISNDEAWTDTWRIQTLTGRTPDEYSIILDNFFEQSGQRYNQLDAVIISSVVPQLTPSFKSILKQKTGFVPLVLDGTLDTGIAIRGREPKTIGADLLADAVAAYDHFGDSCIVVDFGSATTVMAIEAPGVLLGGAICSGLKITADAIVERTAQLPQIPLELPEKAIGRNTQEAMQSGLVLGHLCMVEGLIERMQKELGQKVSVIATGGLSTTIAHHTDYFDAVDPMLTLNGMRLVAEREKK
ncbi:type III pantothenate kinase [Aliifodinibius sp. S!AR15-10]|uniref:type III pantothenate kinase n=1 Tax=Aliifodinibius sp. S!AR15-10 TaxID=2950437 RepID=UPI002855E937|nr:type III pantothenate kinase [Aliifodinibius sp. S!AR15-10]MDR8394494.1 type III pantothenate kinase [Aliifodinibius sp. S!AR15-10]